MTLDFLAVCFWFLLGFGGLTTIWQLGNRLLDERTFARVSTTDKAQVAAMVETVRLELQDLRDAVARVELASGLRER